MKLFKKLSEYFKPKKKEFPGDPYATYMIQHALIEHREKTGEDLLHLLFDNKPIKTKTNANTDTI